MSMCLTIPGVFPPRKSKQDGDSAALERKYGKGNHLHRAALLSFFFLSCSSPVSQDASSTPPHTCSPLPFDQILSSTSAFNSRPNLQRTTNTSQQCLHSSTTHSLQQITSEVFPLEPNNSNDVLKTINTNTSLHRRRNHSPRRTSYVSRVAGHSAWRE